MKLVHVETVEHVVAARQWLFLEYSCLEPLGNGILARSAVGDVQKAGCTVDSVRIEAAAVTPQGV